MQWRSQIKYTSSLPPTQHSNEERSHYSMWTNWTLFFVCSRICMKMIHDSSSHVNQWDFTGKPLISATSQKGGRFWLVTIRIYTAYLDFIPWCKWCFRCNHAKAQLASISLRLKSPAPCAHTTLHPLTAITFPLSALSSLPVGLSLLSSTSLYFSLCFSYLSSFPFLTHLLGQLKASSPRLIDTHTSLHRCHLHRPSPFRVEPLASMLPVVRLDWIQLGRLFALQSLLVGSVDDRFACRLSLLFLSLAHTLLPIQSYCTTSIQLVFLPSNSMQPPLLFLFSPLFTHGSAYLCAHCLHCVSSPCWYVMFFSFSQSYSTRSRHKNWRCGKCVTSPFY